MTKYFYAKLLGHVALVSEDRSLVEWYLRINTKMLDGRRVANDGSPVVFGQVFAQSESEAFAKVRAITE